MFLLLITRIITGSLKENCYIVSTDTNKCLIFDPGADFDKINKYIIKNKFTPKYIFLTHGHYDHIGAVPMLKENYPDIKVIISKEDEDFLKDGDKSLANIYGNHDQKRVDPDIIIKDNETIKIDDISVTSILTPGHTPGGVCYLINHDILITGDTLFKNSVGRTDLYCGDQDKLEKSIKKIYKLFSINNKIEIKIYPGHGFSSNLEKEFYNNPYLNFLKK